MDSPRVVVTGLTGFVGGTVARRLRELRHDVRGIARSAKVRSGPARHDCHAVDTWARHDLLPAVQGARAVVHCASVVHRPGAAAEAYTRFNEDGTRELLEACAEAGVGTFVFVSSIKVYGERTTGVLDETTALAPEGAYATSKVRGEELVLGAARHGLRPTILRLCPVYGRGDRGNVRAMISAIFRRRFFVPGDGTVRKSIVHVSTVADVVGAVLARPGGDAGAAQAAGRTYVIADREAPSMGELSGVIARAVGRRAPPAVPARVLSAVAYGVDRVFRAVGRHPPVTPDLVRKALTPTVCSPARAEAELGVRCHVDLAEAIRDEVAWLRAEGHLR